MRVMSLAEVLAEPVHPILRMPIRNREPREQMPARKWHLVQERDGRRCRICGDLVPTGTGEIDHIRPRSSYPPDQLRVADRSDNLQTTCTPCNQAKSNYAPTNTYKLVGVTSACWDCSHPNSPHEGEATERPHMTVSAYCGRCGHSRVPDESWIL